MSLDPQTKPPRHLTYRERKLAGQIPQKKRARINPVTKKQLPKLLKYREWIKIAMHGLARCERCHEHMSGSLQPHHPSGRTGDHLFEVVAVCAPCHEWIHAHPNIAFAAGWLTPEYRGTQPIPNHPQPFALLPPP